MLEEINRALAAYQAKWQALQAAAPAVTTLQAMQSNAVGWKVADEREYAKIYSELRGDCDKIVETWMNGRWIAKLHLKDESLQDGIKIIKLMQRRPGSEDALGLDHVDFIHPDMKQVEAELQSQQAVKWSWETNDITDNYSWISLWFEDTEAKIKDHSVIDIVIKELKELT